MSEQEHAEFQAKWGEKTKTLKSIGIKPFGFDPGIIATIDGVTVDLPNALIDVICNLVKQKEDLLAACETALGMFAHVDCIQGCGGSGAIQVSEDEVQQCQWCCELDSIKAAIAKAGE